MPITPSEPEGVVGQAAGSSADASAAADTIAQGVKQTNDQLGVPKVVYAVVNTVTPGPPPTCSVTPQGGTTVVAGVKTLNMFLPTVGQTVVCLAVALDYFVLGSFTAGTAADVGLIGYFEAVPSSGTWLVLNGGTFSAVTFPALYAARSNSNVLPDLRNKFIVGTGVTYAEGATGGAATATLAISNLPTGVIGTTVAGQTISGQTLTGATVTGTTGNNSTPHVHNSISGSFPNFLMGGLSGGNFTYSTAAGDGLATPTTGNNTTTHTHPVTSLPVSGGTISGGTITTANVNSAGTAVAFSILPPYYALIPCIKAA